MSDVATDDKLEYLRELVKKASPGPWFYEGRPSWWALRVGDKSIEHVYGPDDVPILECIYDEANAALIAESRNLLPWLLGVAEAADQFVDWVNNGTGERDERTADVEGLVDQLEKALRGHIEHRPESEAK